MRLQVEPHKRIAMIRKPKPKESAMESFEIRKATPGTILHGTLRTHDLLESFAAELEHNLSRNNSSLSNYAELARLAKEAQMANPESDDAPEIVSGLIDALQQFAPDGHYFGAHPGDGADFGYWPNED